MFPKFSEFHDNLVFLKSGMTIEQFSRKVGISRATAGFYLHGDRVPDIITLKKICKAFECSADWILGLPQNVHGESYESAVASDYTGLSKEAVSVLHEKSKAKKKVVMFFEEE